MNITLDVLKPGRTPHYHVKNGACLANLDSGKLTTYGSEWSVYFLPMAFISPSVMKTLGIIIKQNERKYGYAIVSIRRGIYAHDGSYCKYANEVGLILASLRIEWLNLKS